MQDSQVVSHKHVTGLQFEAHAKFRKFSNVIETIKRADLNLRESGDRFVTLSSFDIAPFIEDESSPVLNGKDRSHLNRDIQRM